MLTWRSLLGAPALVVLTGAAAAVGTSSCTRPQEPALGFRDLVETLSEPGGYFDTDNLISNETAYVQVVDDLGPTGGVYIGVGPEQNFHYIGRLRPSWAFIVDIRKDNMLHHLLLNAVLTKAETPYDYLCFLFARRCDASSDESDAGELDDIVMAIDDAPHDEVRYRENLAVIFDHIRDRLDYPLTEEERRVVEFTYRSYFDEQLGLRFRSHGRRPMPHHPTYRKLLTAKSPDGALAHFLSRGEDYGYVRDLARNGRLVPVVGDFAGTHALREIGRFVASKGEKVTAFYVSNVEFYLMRSGAFPEFVENVRALPRADAAQFIRAYFSYGYPHPETLAGHRSTLVRQRMNRFLELDDEHAYRNYWDVSTLDYER